jgi:hypothetical protein
LGGQFLCRNHGKVDACEFFPTAIWDVGVVGAEVIVRVEEDPSSFPLAPSPRAVSALPTSRDEVRIPAVAVKVAAGIHSFPTPQADDRERFTYSDRLSPFDCISVLDDGQQKAEEFFSQALSIVALLEKPRELREILACRQLG